jgi:N6-adenosine-specific RNA methylase IME4
MSEPLSAPHPFAGLTPPYSLILCDPPWTYRDKANAGKRGACHKYATMTVDEICALPVPDLCAKDCLLACWWVGPQPAEALRVVAAWGFRLVNMKGFTWRKLTRTGKTEHFGMGHWSRGNTEDCLFAVRGHPKRVNAGVRQLINAPIREHSRKPDETRERLVQLMGDVPRLEMFARQRVAGWTPWGLEVPPVEQQQSVVEVAA